MVKLFIGAIIIISCTAFGKRYTLKYSQSVKFYECLARFNLQLKQNLMFRHDNLLNLLDFTTANQDFRATLNSFKCFKANTLNTLDLYFPLWANEEDKQFLTDYFISLGKGNADAEMENILYFEEQIKEKLKKIEDKSSKFSNLGQKLGFAVGMAIFIIIL